jgi:hypothetical protein
MHTSILVLLTAESTLELLFLFVVVVVVSRITLRETPLYTNPEYLRFKAINPLKIVFTFLYKNSVHTSQETHYFSATETSRLILLRQRIVVYCENHTKHTNTFCGQNSEF